MNKKDITYLYQLINEELDKCSLLTKFILTGLLCNGSNESATLRTMKELEMYEQSQHYILYKIVKPSSLEKIKYAIFYGCPLSMQEINDIQKKIFNCESIENDGIKIPIIKLVPSPYGGIINHYYKTSYMEIQDRIAELNPISL